MIRVEDLSYGIPAKELYNDISFTIENGQHCVLIGSNGTGKSTLVNMIIDPEEYLFDGKIIMDDSCRIGYASQFSVRDKEQECTVGEYLSEKFVDIQNQIAEVCEEMATADNLDEVFVRYQALLDLNEAMDGDNYESNIHKQLYVADMLGLKETQMSQISGGEYKVIQIIKEMLLAPNLLILDEPDVFLDFDNLASLCELINDYKGTMLVITHNRYLLNHCFNKVLHLENEELIEYEGTFPAYRCEQIREKLRLTIQYNEEQEEVERTQEMVDILRKRASLMVNPTIGRTVNAKQSQLDRLKNRVIDEPFIEFREPIIKLPDVMSCAEEVPTADFVMETDSEGDASEIDVTRDSDESVQDAILTVEDYDISFDSCLLENVNFEIRRGEKVAIVGENGAGKTTLVRDIIRNEHPSIHIDENVRYEWLSQLQSEGVNGAITVKEYMQDRNFGNEEMIRNHLSRYCLGEVDINQNVSKLSVGEQNLLRLAVIEKSEAEFLILDEPTSHLDVYAQTALENAIAEYKGTVLMISHDFYLIANCADYVLITENNTLRRISGRKFRKIVYDKYFDLKYLEGDRKRQELETKITEAFKMDNLEAVEKYCNQLEELSREA